MLTLDVNHLTASHVRYTHFEDIMNFSRFTLAQFFLKSLKQYINPLCAPCLLEHICFLNLDMLLFQCVECLVGIHS